MSNEAVHQEAAAPLLESSKTETAFPFMRLPAELRLQVYRHLLRSKYELFMKRCPYHSTSSDLHPSILRTCHQVHDEAVQVLYEENVFCIHYINEDNPNTSRVKRARARVISIFEWESWCINALTRFLHD